MKTMKLNLKSLLVALISASVLFVASCGSGGGKNEDGKEEKGSVEILYPNWAEGIAFTNLAKVALEAKGYEVKITSIEPGPIYASIAKGDADLFLDAWLPHTHADYWEKYGDKIDKLGESFSNGTTGLVVPQYLDIESIEDLNDNREKFDGKIIGIGSGAGIHRNTEKAIKEYDLDYKQVTSSGPAMLASLRKAYNNNDPIIVTGWKPHHMWANFDLKYLKDPKGVYPKDVAAIVARKGFKKDFPELTKFFANFNFEERELYDLMGDIKDSDDELKAAKEWYKKHKVKVNAWWPNEEKTAAK